MKKLLEYLLVCTLLCAAIAGPSTVFADVCKVYGSQHQYTEEGYEALHPHKEYVACKCGFADYTGGTRTLDDCTECSEDSGPAHTPDDPEDETCAHTTKIKINTQIVDYQQTDVINASTHHAIIHTYSWQCTDCQKTFDPITELMCYAAHNFNSQGVCKECNYCTHTNIRKEYLDGGKVVNKDDYYHHYIENPYKGSCDYCGTVITGVDEEPELHEYDRDGWCFCGYYNEDYCPHDHTKLRDAGYGYGVDGLITETRHFTEHCYEEYCFDCDTIIGNGWADSGPHNPWWEGYWEDHDFGSDGYCVCGYYKEPEVCAHENSELRLTDTTYSMDEIDAEMHWVQYDYDVYCFDCKQVVSTTWEGQGEYHVFNENGYCSACGFQKVPAEITEPLLVTISDWYTEATVGMSIGATAKISGGSGDYTCHWSAFSDQGKHVQSSSDNWSWGITAASEGKWQIKITVHDSNTGEKVSATTRAIRVVTVRDKYVSLLRQYTKWENPLNNRQIYDLVWQRLYPHFGAERTKELIEIVSEAPADYRTLYLYTLYDYDILSTNYDEAKYDGPKNGIYFTKSSIKDDMTIFHEIGHAIDANILASLNHPQGIHGLSWYTQNLNDNLADFILDDVAYNLTNRIIDNGVTSDSARKIADAIIVGNSAGLSWTEKREMERVPDYYSGDASIADNMEDYVTVSDIYGGATGNYVLGKGGHEDSYWEEKVKKQNLSLEFWAEYFSARLRNDRRELSALYGMLPHTCTEMDNLVEILADSLIVGRLL